MALAKIYQPAKTAMQSGRGKTKFWLLEYIPQKKKIVDNLMGWQGAEETTQHVKLKFENKDDAISFARKNNIAFEVVEPNKPTVKIRAYSDNFTNN